LAAREHEYVRKGALHLLAAFDTRTGEVIGLCPPVHCSWMNQVEQGFSILQRKRLAAPNFDDLADLETQLLAFIAQWNQEAHPFNWTAASFEKVLAKIDAALRATAPAVDDSREGEEAAELSVALQPAA
jgi:hypothetical protein